LVFFRSRSARRGKLHRNAAQGCAQVIEPVQIFLVHGLLSLPRAVILSAPDDRLESEGQENRGP
jgi:hypothetical protein